MAQSHLLDFFLQCCSQGSEVVGGFLQLTDLAQIYWVKIVIESGFIE